MDLKTKNNNFFLNVDVPDSLFGSSLNNFATMNLNECLPNFSRTFGKISNNDWFLVRIAWIVHSK